ncbi:MAG TPA: glycosyltransferase family 2 protein [Clostridia bacterium]|nr:glycosyltransferase family 2 protein [Clostridia bacterium]
MKYILDYLLLPFQIVFLLFSSYYFILSIFGFFKPKEKKDLKPEKSFALVVAAHNEEQVIGSLVENLFILDYPKELYDVFVVADNCTDKTADIAASKGAIVYKRFDNQKKGKGYALEWMFEKIWKYHKDYDAVVIFDADNLVDSNFLKEMNNRLKKGEKIIQGYIDAKNPGDTWISASFAISFWVINRTYHMAKYNAGLSTALGGTGMCISMDVLKEYGWGAVCLTEDLEFSMKALNNGIRTTYAPDAIVYDEKVLTFMQSWRQRKRWAQGHVDVASRFCLSLFWKGIKNKNLMMIDAALHLCQPFFLIAVSIFIGISYINYYVPVYTPIFEKIVPVEVWFVITGGQSIFTILCMLIQKVPVKLYKNLLGYPIFLLSWLPITILGFIYKNDKNWSHTLHTRNISYNELAVEKLGKK